MVSGLVALTMHSMGMGRHDGRLPWHPSRLAIDMAVLQLITTNGHCVDGGAVRIRDASDAQNAVVMGRKTFESLPAKLRPLPGRRNVVVSSNPALHPNTVSSIEEALSPRGAGGSTIYILGGREIYRAALPHLDDFFVTQLIEQPGHVQADISFPCALESFFASKANVTDALYRDVCRLRPDLLGKAECRDGRIYEGAFVYSIYHYSK